MAKPTKKELKKRYITALEVVYMRVGYLLYPNDQSASLKELVEELENAHEDCNRAWNKLQATGKTDEE